MSTDFVSHTGACAPRYSTAMLEKLIHASGLMPRTQHSIAISIPNGVRYELFQTTAHSGWDGRDETICKGSDARWVAEGRSALLLVPPIPPRVERNIHINPGRPDAADITHDLPEPGSWDDRLYAW